MCSLVLLCLTGSAAAENFMDQPTTVEFQSSILNKHVVRGALLTDGFVAHHYVKVAKGGLVFAFFGNWDLADCDNLSGNYSEIRVIGQYTFSFEGVDLTGGVINWNRPRGALCTTELFVAGSLTSPEVTQYLSPTLTVVYDIDEVTGAHVNLGATRSFPLACTWEGVEVAVACGASIAWSSEDYNAVYHGKSDGAFSDWHVSLGLPITINDRYIITPSVEYSSILDSGVGSTTRKADNLIAELKLTVPF